MFLYALTCMCEMAPQPIRPTRKVRLSQLKIARTGSIAQRSILQQQHAFQLQQEVLDFQASGEAAEPAVGVDDAMARDD